MFKYWIGHEFPLEFFLDIGNYSIFCLIFFYFYQKKFYSRNFYLLICLLMLTPFLFNNEFISWKINPDQSKYLSISNQVRNGENVFSLFDFSKLGKLKVYFTSYLFAYSPLLNIETFKSGGFLNRFLLVGTTVYLYKKNKVDLRVFLIIMLSPTLTYFSSVFLREIFILTAMIWSVFFIIEKKYLSTIIPLALLILIKFQNAILVLVFFYLNIILNNKKKLELLLLNFLIFSLVFIFYGDYLIEILNNKRKGLYLEEFGSYKGITSKSAYEDLALNINLFFTTFKSFAWFLVNPIFSITSLPKLIVIIETAILYYFLFKEVIFKKKKEIIKITFLWIFLLMFSFSLYSLVVFNDGTLQRFRLIIIIFILLGYNMHKNKILKKKHEK